MNLNIGIIICGFGKIGKILYEKIPYLIEYYKKNNINIELVGIIERNEDKLNKLKNNLYILNNYSNIILSNNLLDFFERESNIGFINNRYSFLIFYDSSPTIYHKFNFDYINYKLPEIGVIKKRVYYFGEKPLFNDKEEIYLYMCKKTNYFIDFIELENPVYIEIKKYINDNNIEIKKMKFYRCSMMGLEKLITPDDRRGVTGGALEDKGTHDLALSIDILASLYRGIDNLVFEIDDQQKYNDGTKRIVIKKPEIYNMKINYFMPYNILSLYINKNNKKFFNYMSINGNEIPSFFTIKKEDNNENWFFAADMDFKISLNWELKDNKKIISEYYFSWIGVPKDELNLLKNKYNLNNDIKLYGEKEKKIEEEKRITFNIEEARIMYLEATKQDNKKIIIIGNLLNKNDLQIKPWWCIIDNNKYQKNICNFNNYLFGEQQILRMLKNVIDICIDLENNNINKNYHNKLSNYVHLIIGQAKENILLNLLNVREFNKINYKLYIKNANKINLINKIYFLKINKIINNIFKFNNF